MTNCSITLAGDGHGAKALVAAFDSANYDLKLLSNDAEVLQQLKKNDRRIYSLNGLAGDIIICSGYMKIIDECVIKRNTVLNIHPSLLPKFRGRHSLAWALLNGEKTVGYTMHLMDKNIDTGHIVYQFKMENKGQPIGQIWNEFHKDVIASIPKITEKFMSKKLSPQPQVAHLSSYFPKREWKDCFITPKSTIIDMRRFIQVMSAPYPRPQVSFGGLDCYALDYQLHKKRVDNKVGKIVAVSANAIEMQLLDGTLLLKHIRKTIDDALIKPTDYFKKGDTYMNE